MYWGYHRKAWTLPFEAISSDFNFIYLFHFDQSSEIQARPDLNVRYFSEFKNISAVFKEIRPSKVIFIGLDGLLSLMINREARKRQIKTLLVQHGFLYKLKDQLTEFRQERQAAIKTSAIDSTASKPRSDKKYSNEFLLRSINLKNLSFVMHAILNRIRHRQKSDHEKMFHFKSEFRLANQYLLYAPYFSNVYVDRDHVKDRIQYIGNPEADQIQKEAMSFETNQTSPYLLHVDQPILHPYKYGSGAKYELEKGREFYTKLNEMAKSRGWRLLIKLHPYSFDFVDLYPQDKNITYIKQHDSLPGLIQESSFVTGFYSTLILPAILLKPAALFEITRDMEFVNDLNTVYKIPVLSMDFSIQELVDISQASNRNLSDRFIEDFFYKTDNGSIERLKQYLSADG